MSPSSSAAWIFPVFSFSLYFWLGGELALCSKCLSLKLPGQSLRFLFCGYFRRVLHWPPRLSPHTPQSSGVCATTVGIPDSRTPPSRGFWDHFQLQNDSGHRLILCPCPLLVGLGSSANDRGAGERYYFMQDHLQSVSSCFHRDLKRSGLR